MTQQTYYWVHTREKHNSKRHRYPSVYCSTVYSRQDMEAPHLWLIVFLHVPVPHASDAFSCPAALLASYKYPKPLPSGEAYLRLSAIPSLCCRPWRLSICLAVYWAKQTSRFTEKLANVEAISLFLSHLLPALSGRSDSSLLLSHPSLLPSQWGLRLLFSLLIPFSRVSSAQPMNAFYSCLC